MTDEVAEDDRKPIDQNEPVAVDPAVEEKARRMGWAPREQWRGPPHLWKTAEEFIAFVDQADNPAVLKENINRLEQKLGANETQLRESRSMIEDQTKVLAQLRNWAAASDEAGYQRAKREAQDKQRAAVTNSDPQAYDQAQRDIDALEEGRRDSPLETRPAAAPAPAPAPPPTAAPPKDPVMDAWVQENSWWFFSGEEIRQTAVAIYGGLDISRPDLNTHQKLNEVLRRIRLAYPEKFQNQRRQAPAAVAEPSAPSASVPDGKFSYANLPTDAKAECDRFIRTIPGYTKESYIAEWQRQEQIRKEKFG